MNEKSSDIIVKTFFKLLPVQIIMVAIGSINSIIDGIFATNMIAPLALSATGLFFPIVKLMDTVNVVLLSGSQVLCGQFMGKNQIDKSKSIFSLDMIVVFIFGILLTFILFFGAKFFTPLFIKDDVLQVYFWDYLRGYAPGITAYLFITQFTAFLQIEHQEKRTYIGMIIMILSNILGDYLFIDVFQLGLFGLGLATSLSNFLYVIILGSFYFKKKATIAFDIKSVHAKDFKDIVRIGSPKAVAQFAQVIRGLLLNYLMLHFIGNSGISAFSAVNTFGCVFFATTAGISNATSLLSSVYFGEEDRAGIIKIMKTALIRGVGLVTGISVILALVAPLLTRIFYAPDAGELYEMTKMGFLLFPLSMPFSCIFCIYSSYFQCCERLTIVNVLSVFDGLIGAGLFSLLLVPVCKMNGIWYAQVLNGLLCILVIFIYCCMQKKGLPKNITESLLLPDSFGVSDENRIDISVYDIQGVTRLSEQIMDFCKQHNLDHKRTMYAGLSVEEMAGNIVQHGFNDKKKHSVDVRIVLKENELLIRLKDDCKRFNPKEVKELFDPEDILHNIGIRMISRMAQSMNYQNSFGLNVLTIIIAFKKPESN